MIETPEVTVILACRSERAYIEKCLHGALQFAPPPGGFEIIVADGLSEDGTREIVNRLAAEFPQLRLIDNAARVTPAGLNAAIRAARGRIIVRIDAHTEYASDYLTECVTALNRTGADNAGGPARTQAHGYLQKCIAAAYHSPFSVGGAKFHDVNYEGWVDTVTYGCWKKEAFDRYGDFDEDLVRNQDDEHNLRIIHGGGKIWQTPKIRSSYMPRSSMVALFKQYMQYGYWKVRVIQKHKLPASWRHVVPGAFVLTLLSLVLFCVFELLMAAFTPQLASSWLRIPISIFGYQLSVFSLGLLLVLGSYGVAVLAASWHTAWRTEWRFLAVLPFVFSCYHFGYGYGFLRGTIDFLIMRRGGRGSFAKLTRDTGHSPAAVRSSG